MIIAGAGGFAKELMHVLTGIHAGQEFIFYDDTKVHGHHLFLNKYRLVSSMEQADSLCAVHQNKFAVGVGAAFARRKLYNLFLENNYLPATIIAKTAMVGVEQNEIADGVIIMDQVIIESCNQIGKGSLVHAGCFISHDVSVGKFCEISPFVKLLGNVSIGNGCTIGTGAIILPGITIEEGATVGAGAVVTKNVLAHTVVVGVPAKPLVKR